MEMIAAQGRMVVSGRISVRPLMRNTSVGPSSFTDAPAAALFHVGRNSQEFYSWVEVRIIAKKSAAP